MELGEVAVCLEYVKQVQSQFNTLFVIVSKGSTNSTKKCFMFQHDLHVFIAQAEIKNALGTLCFLYHIFFVKKLDVVIKVIDVDFTVVYFLAGLYELNTWSSLLNLQMHLPFYPFICFCVDLF